MTDFAYRLSVAAQLEAFRLEIEHACDFLDACYRVRRTSDMGPILHYGPAAPTGSIAVPAALFPAGVRVDKEGIHPNLPALEAMIAQSADGLCRPSEPRQHEENQANRVVSEAFRFARLEERDHPKRDRYGRFPVEAALLPARDGRLEPFADHAARDLAAAITGNPEPPLRTTYEVMFTHDVDTLRGYHRPFEPLRNAVGDVIKRRDPAAAWSRMRHAYLEGEPWTSMRRLMAMSERHNIKSRFYFLGPSEDPMDSPYVIRMSALLRKVADEIRDRGHVLGFHPGFHTFDNAVEWRRQRDGLEAVIGGPLREGRHHVLRYDAAITPRIWSDAGMLLDCTPAYPEVVGFRTGTCRPHHAYDLRVRRTLPLRQLSTAVMEFGLFGGKYNDFTIDEAFAKARWAKEQCRMFGGTLTILLHSGQQDRRAWAIAEQLL